MELMEERLHFILLASEQNIDWCRCDKREKGESAEGGTSSAAQPASGGRQPGGIRVREKPKGCLPARFTRHAETQSGPGRIRGQSAKV